MSVSWRQLLDGHLPVRLTTDSALVRSTVVSESYASLLQQHKKYQMSRKCTSQTGRYAIACRPTSITDSIFPSS
eukprot:1195195-Prorocentrum_minimum.AAC.1